MTSLGYGDNAMPATSQGENEFVGIIEIPLATDPLSLNKRIHWRTAAAITKQWRIFTGLQARRFPELGRCDVVLTWYVVDKRRRDEDNLFRLMKACCDGLVDAGVVIDDTAFYMSKACRIAPAPDGVKTAFMELRVEARS